MSILSAAILLFLVMAPVGNIPLFITSLGSGGAVLTTAHEHQHVRAPTVSIRSKVGAGNSMVAGLVLALSICHAAMSVCFPHPCHGGP